MIGLLATQFLSLFNDYAFRQIVLLMILTRSMEENSGDYQGVAVLVFALPFLLLSGHAGFVADRLDKRRVIIGTKFAELAVMCAAWVVLCLPASIQLLPLLMVLFAMASQSAYLTPAKYGIIASLFGQRQVAPVNGWMQLAGYLGIVGGTASGGMLLSLFQSREQWVGMGLVAVAIAGIVTAWTIPPAPPTSADSNTATTQDGSPDDANSSHAKPELLIPLKVWMSIVRNRLLGDAFFAFAFLWLLAGVYQPLVNAVGKIELGLSDYQASLLMSILAIGISVGFMLSGYLMRSNARGWSMLVAGWGLLVLQLALGLPALTNIELPYQGFFLILFAMGGLTGLIVLPFHVTIQTESPEEIRGRVLGAQHIVNWLAVIGSGILYQLFNRAANLGGFEPSFIFLLIACLMLPGLLLLRPTGERMIRWRPLTISSDLSADN